MLNRGLHLQVGILSLIVIYIVIRELLVLPFYIYLYVQFIAELHRIYHHVSHTRQELRLEEEHRRRSGEISIILKTVSMKLGQITNEETIRLEIARAEARKRRSEDVATIVSLVMKQILELQTQEKVTAEKEAATKLNLQRAAEEESLRQHTQTLVKVGEEKPKATKLEYVTAPEPQYGTSEFARMLPDFLKDLDPLGGDFTCIGQTLQRRRCRQWMLSHADKAAAARRLESMRSKDPGNSYEQEQLLHLANWMLCNRQHTSGKHAQGERISRQWYRELKPARDLLSVANGASKAIPFTLPDGSNHTFGSPTSVPPWPISNGMSTNTGTLFGSQVTPQKGRNDVFVASTYGTPQFGRNTNSTAENSSPSADFGSPASSVPSFGTSSTTTTPCSSTGFPVTPPKWNDHSFGSPRSTSSYFGTQKTDNKTTLSFGSG